jgi:hypothetical protein
MKRQKLSLANIPGRMSRVEMKSIYAGETTKSSCAFPPKDVLAEAYPEHLPAADQVSTPRKSAVFQEMFGRYVGM